MYLNLWPSPENSYVPSSIRCTIIGRYSMVIDDKIQLRLTFSRNFGIEKSSLDVDSMIFHTAIIESPHEKTNNLHMRKQRRRSISFAVTAKLISAFVFATRIVHFLFFQNPKFQATSLLLCLYSSVCVRPVRKPRGGSFHVTSILVSVF